MKQYRYVILDPTGNLTALVLDPVAPEDEKRLTGELLKQSEQVAYLKAPGKPGTVAAIRLMGGEFCGNASMAAAAWLVRNETQEGEERTFLLEVSGAAEPVPCTVRKTATGFEGTVEMPGVPVIQEASTAEWTVPMVRFEGITHLIFEGACFSEEEAGNILVRLAAEIPDKAIGLLRWNRETQEMLPLVYVRESNSMVREHGCGSGSAAVGAYEALRSGREMFAIPVRQPGGIIRVDVRTQKDTVCAVSITGQVRLGQETIITI